MMTGQAVHSTGKPSDLPAQIFTKLVETSKHSNTPQTQ